MTARDQFERIGAFERKNVVRNDVARDFIVFSIQRLLAISVLLIAMSSIGCGKVKVAEPTTKPQSLSQSPWSIAKWVLGDADIDSPDPDQPDPDQPNADKCDADDTDACDDSNPCTIDLCEADECTHEYGTPIFRHALQHPNPSDERHFDALCHFSYGHEDAGIPAPFNNRCGEDSEARLLFFSVPAASRELSDTSLISLYLLKDENKLNPMLSLLETEGPFTSEDPSVPTIIADVLPVTIESSLADSEHIIPVYRFRKEDSTLAILLGHVSVIDIDEDNLWTADPNNGDAYQHDGASDGSGAAIPAFFACKGPVEP